MKISSIVAMVLVVLLLVAAGCQNMPFQQKAVAQPPNTATVNRGSLEIAVTSSGTITLPQITKLGFSGAISGSQAGNAILSELNVSMGSRATKGQVIARLDTSDQEKNITRLETNLETARISLEKIKQSLYKADDFVKAENAIVTAKSNLAVALEALKKAQNPYTENDFAKAEAAVRNATADVRNAVNSLASAQEDVETTARKDAQAIKEATEAVLARQKEMGEFVAGKPRATEFDVLKANEALELAMRQAENNVTTGKNNIARARDAVATAETNLATAKFNLNDMVAKKSGEALDIVQREAAVVNAQLAVTNAENALERMKEPPDPLDVRLKEIQVTNAQLQLDEARDALSKSTLIAPFDGVIGDFKAKVGDTIAPGSFYIPVVDTTQARVDAYVEEYDVNSVRLGMPVVVTMDAVRGQTFNGTVDAISPLSTSQQGVVRYAMTIKIQTGGGARGDVRGTARGDAGAGPATDRPRPAPGDGAAAKPGAADRGQSPGGQVAGRGPARGSAPPGAAPMELKDGLSATAKIVISKKDDILYVPNRALKFQGGQQTVQVMVNEQVQERAVKTGMTNDQYTEITGGLKEGDRVVVQATTSPQGPPRLPGGGLIPGLK